MVITYQPVMSTFIQSHIWGGRNATTESPLLRYTAVIQESDIPLLLIKQ